MKLNQNKKPVLINILQIENDKDSLEKIKEMLLDSTLIHFDIHTSNDLNNVKKIIKEKKINITILNVDLENKNEIEIFERLKEIAPKIPIIITTDDNSKNLSMDALSKGAIDYLSRGAQDFLIKNHLNNKKLIRSILFAVERSRFHSDINKKSENNNQNDYFFPSLTKFAFTPNTPITSKLYNEVNLKDAYPEIYKKLVEKYINLIKLSVEEKIYKSSNKVSENLRSLSEELGFLKAGPKDIVEIHSQAVKEIVKKANSINASNYTKESEIVLLGLMGNLALFYRTYYFMVWKKNLSNPIESG